MKEWNKCPGCGMTITSVFSYCSNCGEPWTIECSKCGKTRRFWESNKFCPNCGTPVEKQSVAGRKSEAVKTIIGKPKVHVE